MHPHHVCPPKSAQSLPERFALRTPALTLALALALSSLAHAAEVGLLVEDATVVATMQGVLSVPHGGALTVSKGGNVKITGEDYSGFFASSQGGAVYNNGHLSISDTTFSANEAFEGGAIFTGGEGSSLSVVGSRFENNRLTGGDVGGALTVGAYGQADIEGSVFSGNSATDGWSGAIYAYNSSTISIRNSAFEHNSALGTGAVGLFGQADLENVSFDHNEARGGDAGAVFLGSASQTRMHNVRFTDNQAAGIGGALATRPESQGNNQQGQLDLVGALFENNVAGGHGGAFYNAFQSSSTHADSVYVADATFNNNRSGGNGGAIYNAPAGTTGNHTPVPGSLWLENTVFTGNQADGQGGAIFNAGELTLAGNNYFAGNQAGGVLNDIHNTGSLTLANGTTHLQGGISGTGDISIGQAELVLDVSTPSGSALQGGTVTVDENAKLTLTGVTAGNRYQIVEAKELTIADGSWQGDNLGIDNKLLSATLVQANGSASVQVGQNKAEDVLVGIDGSLASLVDNMVASGMTDLDSDNEGERFINRAVNLLGNNALPAAQTHAYDLPASADKAAATIEGAAKVGLVGAVPQMLKGITDAAQYAVAARSLLADSGQAQGVSTWAAPHYQRLNASGLESGAFSTGYRGSFSGVVLGADFTPGENLRLGLTAQTGSGEANSSGDFNATRNNFDYAGAGAYASLRRGAGNLIAEVHYSQTDNALQQQLPVEMDMAALKADVDASTLTASLRGEYQQRIGAVDVVLHAGARVNHLHMKAFDVRGSGFQSEKLNATIWEFPLGVTFRHKIPMTSGWTLQPQGSVSFIPATGDLNVERKVGQGGVAGLAEVSSQLADKFSVRGTLGLSAENDRNTRFDVQYGYQGSSHSEAHGVQARVRYLF